MDIMDVLALGIIFMYGTMFGVILGAFFINKYLRRQIAWRMGTAKKGFAFIVRSGRKSKVVDWDTREPHVTVGSQTYIIYQSDVFDWGGVPCALVNARIGRSIPCEQLPEDVSGLYNPTGIYSYGIMVYNLMEAKVDRNRKKIMEMLLWGAAICAGLAVLMGFLAFNQAGTSTEFASNAAKYCGEMLNRTIPMVR